LTVSTEEKAMSEGTVAEAVVAAEQALTTTEPKDGKHPIKVGERGLSFESASEVYRMAQAFVAGGVAPKGSTAGGVMAAMMKGAELGIAPITAVTSISVVNGRTQMAGSLVLAVLKRAGVLYEFWWDGEGNKRAASIKAWMPGRKPMTHTFTMGDAVRAGLASKDTYKAWPDEMLLWRAVAKMGRQQFPDVCAGIYVHGEIPGDPAPDLVATATEAPAPTSPPGPDPLIAELSGTPAAVPAEEPECKHTAFSRPVPAGKVWICPVCSAEVAGPFPAEL
jgi:hypothetical protein